MGVLDFASPLAYILSLIMFVLIIHWKQEDIESFSIVLISNAVSDILSAFAERIMSNGALVGHTRIKSYAWILVCFSAIAVFVSIRLNKFVVLRMLTTAGPRLKPRHLLIFTVLELCPISLVHCEKYLVVVSYERSVNSPDVVVNFIRINVTFVTRISFFIDFLYRPGSRTKSLGVDGNSNPRFKNDF
jgi:hypothetical protein